MLKKLFPLFFVAAAIFAGEVSAQDTGPDLGIIPAPVSVQRGAGSFTLNAQTAILADSVNHRAVTYLAAYLQPKPGITSAVKQNNGKSATNSIVLTADGTNDLPA